MNDILMIVHTMGTLDPSDNDRFTYIANILLSRGNNVEIVTSDFEHHKKKYRNCDEIKKKYNFKITFLHEKKYKKNVSLKRIFAHISFAKELKKYLKKRKKPSVIYCAIPPTFSSKVAAKYCKANNIKYVIDLQDLWPESFKMILGNNLLSNLLLYPLKKSVNYSYKYADVSIAVSQTYLNRILEVNKKSKENIVAFLGTDRKKIDYYLTRNDLNIEKGKGEFWVGYIGNIGKSYDFKNVFLALEKLKQDGIDNVKFMIVGDGNYRDEVEQFIIKYFSNTIITGYLPYNLMFQYLKRMDIVLNPIISSSASTIVNKVGDYAAAGIPVINSQPCDEYRELVDKYNCGINANTEDYVDIYNKMKILFYDEDKRKKMGLNNRKLFEDKFDRNVTYIPIIFSLEG